MTPLRTLFALAALLPAIGCAAAAEPPKPLVTGLKNPESAAVAPDGTIYVTVIGEFDKDGDGGVMRIDGDKAVPFCTGLDDPKGLVIWKDTLFVADKTRIWKIDKNGKAEQFAKAADFPVKPLFLNDLAIDEKGVLYASDSGDLKGAGGAVFRIGQDRKVTLVTDAVRNPAFKIPNGLAMDGAHFLVMADFGAGELHRIRIADGAATKIAEGIGAGDGLVFDRHGRLFVSDYKGGRVFGIARPGGKPVLIASGFQAPADFCLDASGRNLLVPDMKAGTLTVLPAVIPGEEVDDTPLQVGVEVAFPNLKWAGWQPFNDAGISVPLRPLVLTHAGDGSNRVFVATQHGVIHVFPNDQKAEKTEVFLDISAKVQYQDKTNEEGFLGLAFHPKYKENGEFFAFYTLKDAKLTNVLSRFRVSKDNPNRADPASEEELFRIERPFWNHDGGTLCFGPDGHLYIALGDGGSGNDPFGNGQNLGTKLGKILRLDVNRKDAGKNYAIPADNPFVNRKDALPEIWAYGVRNIWRMAFDRKTGKLWAADVGQDLYEEIDIVHAGANLGWNVREGLHPFGDKGVGPRDDLLDPIWEYRHDVGRSITGGSVYHGKIAELEGCYLYADYIMGHINALKYDEARKRVVSNRKFALGDAKYAVVSFGEDERGEAYFLIVSPKGLGLHRFVPTKVAAK